MLVRSDRRFAFDADRATVWAAIAAVDEYRTWWPWLRRFEADALKAGAEWVAVVQPPLAYSLRFTITIDDVVDHESVSASIAGDITGFADLTLCERDAGGCDARLVSQLAPASSFLQAVALVARPVVRFGHDWVLDTGARQFRARALP